jgi:hypothetical protein
LARASEGRHCFDPPPQVEPPFAQWDQPVDAVDVTPPPFRPPMPPAPTAPPAPPKVRSNVGVPPEVLLRELKRPNHFLDGDWGDPKDHFLRIAAHLNLIARLMLSDD